MAESPVLIVGGGLGGLTLSLCLAKIGISSKVFERRSQLSENGAGIQLSPNCLRVYDHLGMVSAIAEIAHEPSHIEFREWRQNRILSKLDLSDFREKLGFPYFTVHRGQLIDLLLSRVLKSESIELHLDREVEHFSSDENGVQIQTGEDVIHGALLVGADGIRSTIRSELFGLDDPTFTGHVAWRALIPIERLPQASKEIGSRVWWGPGKHLVTYPVQCGSVLNCVAVVENKAWAFESWHEPGELGELLKEFSGWNSDVLEIIQSISNNDLYKWGLFSRNTLKNWSKDRIVLLGDACHAPLPFMAQGAAMAIEDAACLSYCLTDGLDYADSFSKFESLRKARTQKVLTLSARNGRVFHLSGLAAMLRNVALKFYEPRFNDFLYGYNVFSAMDEPGR